MRKTLIAAALLGSMVAAPASAASLTFTQLTGLTGGTLAATAVFRADVGSAGLGNILSITITDDSVLTAGSPGQFSGFDLDAIKLSTTLCATAACAATAVGLNVFNFGAGTLLAPGAQQPAVDPKLFGTNAAGNDVDNAVATLGAFDAESTTAIPGADGFVSIGFGGSILFNLTALTATSGLYLYIGEVGDNGEVADSNVVIRETPGEIPEPSTYAMLFGGLAMLGFMARRRIR